MKKGKVLVIVLSLLLFSFSVHAQTGQKTIDAVELMPNIPEPYEMRDWADVTRKYDALVFDFEQSGEFLPLIKWDNRNINFNLRSFMIPSYVGLRGGNEALTQISAVLGSSLVGIDKSDQAGYNWVLMTKQYYNARNGLGIVNNNVNSIGGSFWYNTWPGMLFFMLVDQYPDVSQIKTPFSFSSEQMSMEDIMYETASRWADAIADLRQRPDINRANIIRYDHINGEPVFTYEDDRYRYAHGNQLYEGAVGIAWMNYMAYIKWGEPRFIDTASWCMEFVENVDFNPLYEVILPYGAYLAARLNAELGTEYDVKKYIEWSFGPADSRPNWGIVHGNWNGTDVNGLMGSLSTDYVFAMNTFATVAAFVPAVRYDSSYARAVGKFTLNAANNARLFYGKFHDAEHQSCPDWEGDPESVIAYEALRREWNGTTMYAMGDGVKNDWAETDFGLYGSSHVGMLGAIVATTNIEKILQLDLLATDYFHDSAYPSYLYYNPYNESKEIIIDLGDSKSRLYDATISEFITEEATGETEFVLEPDSAAVIIVVPADGVISYEGNWLLVNDVVVDYSRSSVWIDNIADGDVVSDQQYVAISTIQLDDLAVKETIVSIDQQEFYRTDGLTQEFNFNTLSYDNGSKHILTVGVQTRDGLHFTDSVEITVDNRILGRIGALDLRNWKPHKLYPARLTVTNQTSIITKSNADDHWGALVSPVFEVDLGLRPFLSVDGLYAPGMYLIILRLADGTEIDLAKNAKTNPFKVDLNQAIKDAEVDITGIHQGQLIIGTYSATRNVSIWNFSENFKLFYQD